MDFNGIISKISCWCDDHENGILTAANIISTLGAVASAAASALKIERKIELKKIEKNGEKLTAGEVTKIVAKDAVLPVVCTAASVWSVVRLHNGTEKIISELEGSVSRFGFALEKMTEAVAEKCGEEVKQELSKQVNQEIVEHEASIKPAEIEKKTESNRYKPFYQPYWEPLTGNIIWAREVDIDAAVNEINAMINQMDPQGYDPDPDYQVTMADFLFILNRRCGCSLESGYAGELYFTFDRGPLDIDRDAAPTEFHDEFGAPILARPLVYISKKTDFAYPFFRDENETDDYYYSPYGR